MSDTFHEHRPLRAGVWIRTAKPNDSGGLDIITRGTLTGLATRTDGTRVLVTAKHAMTGSATLDPTGNEGMYQQMATYRQMTDDTAHAALAIDATKKVGTAVSGLSNDADATMCTLESSVLANFKLHTHANASEGGGHEDKVIVGGTVDPTAQAGDVKGTSLLILGANRKMRAHVVEIDQPYPPTDTNNAFSFTVVLGDGPLHEGDSGAPCLVDMGNNQYKMCGILVSGGAGTQNGFAIPASDVEQELGITFGNHPPVVDAGDARIVGPGDTITLVASVSDQDSGNVFYYQWSKVTGDTVTITNPNARIAKCVLPSTFRAPQTLTFRLKVTDSDGGWATDDVDVDVVTGLPTNQLPTANAGTTQTVEPGEQVRLHGSGSDPDNNLPLAYRWDQDLGPNPLGLIGVLFSDYAGPETTFMAPDTPQVLTFVLTVTDARGGQATSSVDVRVDRWGPWTDTGETKDDDYAGAVKEQTRTSALGRTQDRWVEDIAPPPPTTPTTPPTDPTDDDTDDDTPPPPPEVWPTTGRPTGTTVGCGPGKWSQVMFTSNLGNTRTGWEKTPEADPWGAWIDTGRTETIDAYTAFKEQTRTSHCGNTETQWVSM